MISSNRRLCQIRNDEGTFTEVYQKLFRQGSPAEISGGYHNLSHHGKSEAKPAQLDAIDRSHMKLPGKLVADLQSSIEGESNHSLGFEVTGFEIAEAVLKAKEIESKQSACSTGLLGNGSAARQEDFPWLGSVAGTNHSAGFEDIDHPRGTGVSEAETTLQ